jgi:hypothetical protein
MFFFPETMLNRVRDMFIQEMKHVNSYYAEDALDSFNSYCKEYLGLGFLASFLPGTNAYKARKKLSIEIKKAIPKIEKCLQKIPNINWDGDIYLFHRLSLITSLKGVIADKLLLGPLWRILHNNCREHFNFQLITLNYGYPIKRLVSLFPILTEFYYVDKKRIAHWRPVNDILSNLFHTLRNPIRLIDQALNFFHATMCTILSIGSEKGRKSNFIQIGLKGIIATAFFLVAIPVKIGMKILDIPFDLAKNIIYRPIKFILLSAYDNCCKRESNSEGQETKPTNLHSPTQAMYKKMSGSPPPSSPTAAAPIEEKKSSRIDKEDSSETCKPMIPFGYKKPQGKNAALLFKLGFDLNKAELLEDEDNMYYLTVPTSLKLEHEGLNKTYISLNGIRVIDITKGTGLHDDNFSFDINEPAIEEAIKKEISVTHISSTLLTSVL